VIVRFVGIDGIDDHHCLNFLFIFCVQWVKVRGDCLCCWCWLTEHKIWKESLNSDGHQFYQYQQNKQSPLTLTHWTQNMKRKFKQWWSSIPPIPTKQAITSHLNSPFSELRWEVIVCFVGIGKIDDHHCLIFLFIFCVQWVKVRGDCSLCWYWWNWWPSLFKLSFHILCSVS
jgi:hypothetical protein